MRFNRVLLVTAALAVPLLVNARGPLDAATAGVQVRVADVLFQHSDYRPAMVVYERAAECADREVRDRARAGVIRSALRIAEFEIAATQAAALRSSRPSDAETLTLSGDALWASGLFEEAEAAYRDALALEPANPRGRHGLAKALASRSRLDAALDEAEAALGASPRDPELQYTVGFIHERMHRFDLAADAIARYLDLLPERDREDKAQWGRGEVDFLRSFGGVQPYQIVSTSTAGRYVVPFRVVNGKIVIKGRVNGRHTVDFVLDSGSEETALSGKTARRIGLVATGRMLSAGVGEAMFRGLERGRIGSLEFGPLAIRNLPCLVKNPPLMGLPWKEGDGFSPLALGLSVSVDYKRRQVTFGQIDAPAGEALELPLRFHRLATVRGVAAGRPASFVVDTGGSAISLSTTTARLLFKPADRRRIALQVYGTSGIDREAYLLPGINLAFDALRLQDTSVVVMNLRAPSVLVGYEIGGIVGHEFLKNYRVEFDLDRSVLRLTPD